MKKQILFKPTNVVLDEEESQIEQALERGDFEDDPNFEQTKAMLEEAASRYIELSTSKPITIRVNQLDLIKVRAKAKRKNIPYQTLLGSIIHQYAET